MFNIFENFIFVVKLTLFGVTFLAQSHTTRLLSQQRDCCFHICLAVSRFDFASQSWWAVAAHTILLCFLFFFSSVSLNLQQNALVDWCWHSCPAFAYSALCHHQLHDHLFSPSCQPFTLCGRCLPSSFSFVSVCLLVSFTFQD